MRQIAWASLRAPARLLDPKLVGPDPKISVDLVQMDLDNTRPASDFAFYVVSHKRPENVKAMEARLEGCAPCWVVGQGEAEAYAEAGATRVVEGGSLCASRNLALEEAFKNSKVCVQLSDDVDKLEFVDSEHDKNWTKPSSLKEANARANAATRIVVSFADAARYVEASARANNAYLGGVYPNANAGQCCGGPVVMTQHFIVGDFTVVAPSTPRYDEKMTLKEDYDLTCQHLFTYGVVGRCNRLLITAQHYTNKGGAVAIRNTHSEAKNIAFLRAKWPGCFLNSPRGAKEVRLRWDLRDEVIGGSRIFEPDPKNPGRAIYDQTAARAARAKRLLKENNRADNKKQKTTDTPPV